MDTALTFLIWLAAFAVLLHQAWYGKTPVAGLGLCYWLNLASVHVLTEGLCLIYENKSPYRFASECGFPLSGYAVLGLTAGNLLLAPLVNRVVAVPSAGTGTPAPGPADTVPLAVTAIVVGMSLYLVGNVFDVPSLSAVTAAGNMMAIGGFAWCWWTSYRSRMHLRAWGVLAGSLVVPFLILILHGFLSFGIYALLMLTAFVIVYFRPRIVPVIAAVPALYLGLSACVTYLQVRGDIRQSVWRERAELSERTRMVGTAFHERWEWFDPMNERQRQDLDARFDQNYFVGLAERRIDTKQMDYVRGDGLKDAALALIPRLLWRQKPAFLGGSGQMSRFTGLKFAPGVTFGLGHVLEAYVNYGVIGLLICFTALGTALGVIDRQAGLHLRAGRFDAFFMWFVPGQALLNGGVGSFAELTGGLAGALVLTWLFLRIHWMASRHEPALPTVGRRQTLPRLP